MDKKKNFRLNSVVLSKSALFSLFSCIDLFGTSSNHTGRFKKNAQMFVCLISPEPMNGFQHRFFLLKTEIHM